MAVFNNMVITAKGEDLYNKVQAGIPLNFTKMKIGSGQLAESDNPETFTVLKDYKFDVSISSITQNTQLQVAIISGTINNTTITEGQYICELGLFAEDPDEGEILYGYTNAGTLGDYIAPNNKGAFAWNYQVNAAVGNAAEVTATVSSTTFDYAVASSSTTFAIISGTNQKEINQSIDTTFGLIKDTVNFEAGSFTATEDNTASFTITDVPYNPETDHVELFYLGNQRLALIDNYTMTGARIDLVDWALKSGEKITYNIWKFVNHVPIMADGANLQDNSVALRSLTEDVQENINQVPALTSQMADMTVNVRFLGAKCDGITDDWKVIQNYLDNNLSNYNLSFPMNKICYVSKSLVINDQHYNVHLVGQLGSVLYTDKQIVLIDFQGTWDYVGIRQVIQNCSIENLRLKYSLVKSNIFSELYAVGGMKSFHSEDFSLPDDFTGNINSIAIQANSFYINKIKDCSIEGFGYGIKLNRECCRNIISGNSIRNCRAPIYCKKNAVCNANIIEDNNITDNLGLPIFIDIGASNVIKNNDIEGNYRTINNLPGNEIMFLDINNNVINASAIYLNNCRKTFIAGNYFEGNDRWYNGLCITQPIMLDGISKITTLIEGNYYNISEMDLTNTSSQFIMGNSKINFDDGNYIGEGGATNIIGDNLVINPEFNLSYDTNTIVANKTITVGNLSYMRNHYIVYLAQPDVIPITIVNSSKFNGYKNIQFNAQGCLISRVGVLFNIPDNLLHSGSQFSLKFGIWVKSERVGTLSMYPMIISSDSIRINETICSQFNTQENKYEFITGYLSINNAKNLIKNPSFAIYFISPRCLVNTVTKVSDTELKINCSYSVSANTSNYFKTGDTVTLSDGQSGVISQINSDDSIVLQGDYLNYIPSGITHIVVTAFAEGHCNVSIECPQAVSKGMLQPYSPNKMKNCITKEYILDDSGTLVLSRDEFNGKLAIAEAITLKYTCGSTPCNGTITCKQFINGYVNADTRTVIANANTNSAITLGALQSNDYNITYMNLNTLTSKKIIIQWWIPEEV